MEMKLKKAGFKYFFPVQQKDHKHTDKTVDLDLSTSLKGMSDFGSGRLFLKRLNVDDFYRLLTNAGLLEHLKKIGLPDIKITISIDEYAINYLKLYYKEESPESLLMDLRVTEGEFKPDTEVSGSWRFDSPLQMIVIEWLSLQNPYREFNENRPRLPGQNKPGLGALSYCFDVMHTFCLELVKDGIMDIPDQMSGAVMYSKKFKFFNPRHEAILYAVMRDLSGYNLRDISWGIITGTIINESKNIPQIYEPSEQIFAVSRRMKKYFNSKVYKSIFNNYYDKLKYRFDYDAMLKKREEMLKQKDEAEL